MKLEPTTRRVHASTIAESRAFLVVAWFGGTREGAPDVGIWCSVAGEQPTQLVEPYDGIPCWNPVLIQVPGGPLLLFYKVGFSPRDWRSFMRVSPDGGKSWQHSGCPAKIGPDRNHPVMVAGGTLLCPSSIELGRRGPWSVHFELIDSQLRDHRVVEVDNGEFDAIQPAILQHKDGRLQALCRTRQGVIAETWSIDDGQSWSPLAATSLPNPNSGIDAVTLRDGRHLLVYNRSESVREHLTVAISEDGVAWDDLVELEGRDGGRYGYSYPSVIQDAQGHVHVTYTWKLREIRHTTIEL